MNADKNTATTTKVLTDGIYEVNFKFYLCPSALICG